MSDNNTYHFAPHDVAGMIDIGVQSVRRWAEYHKGYFSESANPKPGDKRYFTWADVETFRRIKALRDAGFSVEAINIKLSETITEASKNLNTTVSLIAPQDEQESQIQTPGAIVALEAINAIRSEIEALKASVKEDKQLRQNGIFLFLLGLVAGMVLIVGLLSVAVLYGGFR